MSEWFWNAIGARLGWLAIDVAFGLIFVAGAILIMAPSAIRKMRCKHDGRVFETGSCDAVCSKCGLNLGFIGAWREKQRDIANKVGQ